MIAPVVDDRRFFYKFTGDGRRSIIAHRLYPEIGRWAPTVRHLQLCDSGHHVAARPGLIDFLGDELYVAEVRGRRIGPIYGDKFAFERMRLARRVETWNENSLRLLVCDCVEHILPWFEEMFPGDMRPRSLVEAVRKAKDEEAYSGCREAYDLAYRVYASRFRLGRRNYAKDDVATWAAGAALSLARPSSYGWGGVTWQYIRRAAALRRRSLRAEREWQYRRLLDYIEGRTDE